MLLVLLKVTVLILSVLIKFESINIALPFWGQLVIFL